MKEVDVTIIGAGPAGIMAAISARMQGARVLLVEKNDRIGKKILSTGNGRCNLTNSYLSQECYYSSDAKKSTAILKQYDNRWLLDFFQEYGLLTSEKNGYYYPKSMQAKTVRDQLEAWVNSLDIEVMTQAEVVDITMETEGYKLSVNHNKIWTKTLVFALGGLASPKCGSDGSGFKIVESLDIKIQDFVPGLVALQGSDSFYKELAGNRADADIVLRANGRELGKETGELQFTDYGISGIPVFQVSRLANMALKNREKVELLVDFLPEYDAEELLGLLLRKQRYFLGKKASAGDLLDGLMNYKITSFLAKECHISFKDSQDLLKEKDLRNFVLKAKKLCFHINGSKGFDSAQVSAGGVSLLQVSDELESLQTKGTFFAGELLDIDGICGGYNLQWAFSSGFVAGMAAAKRALL